MSEISAVPLSIPRSMHGYGRLLIRAYDAGQLLGGLHRVLGVEPSPAEGCALTFAIWGKATERGAATSLASLAGEVAPAAGMSPRASGSVSVRTECCAVAELVGSPPDPLRSALEITRALADARATLEVTCHAWRWYDRPSAEQLLGEVMRWGTWGFALSPERFLRKKYRGERSIDLAYWMEGCSWADEEE